MTIKFELDERQENRFKSWWDWHYKEFHDRNSPHPARRGYDSFGTSYELLIVPYGMGTNISAKCLWCGVGVSLSLDDDDEFVYNEDGTPNGWAGESFRVK